MKINYEDNFIFYNDNYDKEDEMVDITNSDTEDTNNTFVSGDNFSDDFKPRKRNTKTMVIACCIAGVVLLGTSIAGVAMMNKPENKTEIAGQTQDFTYPEGTVVSGISLSGKTYDESLKLLNAKKEYFIDPITITVNANGNKYTLTQDNFEYDFNTEEILNELKKKEENSIIADSTVSYEVIATCKKESIKKQVEELKKKADKQPVNARVSEFKPYGGNNRFKYEEAKPGYIIDANDLETQLAKAVTGTKAEVELSAKVNETKAPITMAMVKKNIVQLATYETIPMSTASAIDNMKTALDACSGSVIEPGKTWSFSGSAGDTNLESNGYKPAGVIVNGEMTEGIGGGVCQASSTVYNAGIRANMEIVERHCHTFASDYVPTGLDSTIAYPVLDLKMKNTTDYQMFLECKMVDGKLTVTFWGYKDPSYDEIKVANEISDVEDGEFSARAWRVYYKDGKEIKREELGSSQYEASGGRGGGSAEGVTGLIPSTSSTTAPTRPENNNNSSSGEVRPPLYDVPDPVEPTQEPQQPTEEPTEPEVTEPESEPTEPPTEPEPTEPVEEPTEAEAENADIQNEE